jgi:hypothetical protein
MSSTPYVRAIWMWKHMVDRCLRFFQELNSDDQVLEIRYEALMRQPHQEANRIHNHLGAKKTHAFERHLNRARTSSIDKHSRRSDDEIAAATDLAAHSLERLGYA